MTRVEEKIIEAYEGSDYSTVNLTLSFEDINIKDMTRVELELLCAFMGLELMRKVPRLEVSMKIKNES